MKNETMSQEDKKGEFSMVNQENVFEHSIWFQEYCFRCYALFRIMHLPVVLGVSLGATCSCLAPVFFFMGFPQSPPADCISRSYSSKNLSKTI